MIDNLLTIILATFLVSLISFSGISLILLKENVLRKILIYFVTFGIGALLANSFFDLIPESFEKANDFQQGFFYASAFLFFGFIFSFFLENFIHWHHHHKKEHPEIKSFSWLIVISDTFHNFIDGFIIAGAFIIDLHLGLIVTLAVIFHEIPQEISDFAIILYGGFSKIKALFFNFLSALSAVFGGILGFYFLNSFENYLFLIASFAAGNFLYIACADLMPELKQESSKDRIKYFFVLILGALLIIILGQLIGESYGH